MGWNLGRPGSSGSRAARRRQIRLLPRRGSDIVAVVLGVI